MSLIWTTKPTKCIANASFYRPKFGIIDLMTNCWVGDQLLTWWKVTIKVENDIRSSGSLCIYPEQP